MKIAVATQQGGLSDQVSPMVGRTPTFTLVEVENDKIKDSSIIQNQYAQSASGAGIQAAQMLVNEGIKAILGGNFVPNLSGVFSQVGVQMYQVQGETVKKAVKKYLKGELAQAPGATGPAHGGMGMTPSGGMGRGMGMGGGMGGGQGTQMSKEQELRNLNEQVKALEQQLNQVKRRIKELKEQ